MLKGLRTIVYHVSDLTQAKEWYKNIFGIEPYFDEPFYVGYNVGGYELGLDPDASGYGKGNTAITYWGVEDIHECFNKFAALGIEIHEAPKNVGGAIWVASIYDPFKNIIGLIENPEFSI
ncbi:MAG: VOC family protein [Bacteroidota bacterium]|uniref:VOC family protein n=1 Tax=Pedobacter cryotolerans TaxID=2571270 RepID=A0A4V5NXT5_9SPHI|nr:VOC family protein [Pedobacter cryotolerans]TKB99865.1 VOC family protein [Pedobacter cryotolerans]